MTVRVRVVILGCTGSIGRQALDVASRHADRIEVVGLAAHTSAEQVVEQAHAFNVQRIVLSDSDAAGRARDLGGDRLMVGSGPEAVAELAELPEAEVVLNALVGAAGLRATLTALAAGKTLALANKESLVAGGELVTALATESNLVPVDSEHSAIYQCLVGEERADVERIWLTASGGPFRGRSAADMANVTVEEALAHPTWNMGPKISIDSATLANKGLEVIEAHHLFGVDYDRIRVLVHPQSIVHSMVEFADASVKAHLGTTDMRIPIQYAFSRPRRWDAPVAALDFAQVARLDFGDPDVDAFPALSLAFAAGKAGGTMPAVMNAANEVAVAAFLSRRAGFADIPRTIESVMAAHDAEPLGSLEQVEAADTWARARAEEVLSSR
ncbi:MAG: 1-deoxy-D-xylulose-5-phosphate reductoisomerase [Coriobacteriales bacterium]|nr:1-deoxy-D-xylulose-5-phosphate reductoisomerase [Coriobacteriales bacterium]